MPLTVPSRTWTPDASGASSSSVSSLVVASTPIDVVIGRISSGRASGQLRGRGERRAGELPGLAVRAGAGEQQVVDGPAADDGEHPTVAVDHPEHPVGAGVGGHGLALADVDQHVVREVGADPRRLDPRAGLQLALDLLRVDEQDRLAAQLAAHLLDERGIGVLVALHVDVADVEQRRGEQCDDGDDDAGRRRR